jgi:hypothetical protein
MAIDRTDIQKGQAPATLKEMCEAVAALDSSKPQKSPAASEVEPGDAQAMGLGALPLPNYWLFKAEIAYQNGAMADHINFLKHALSLMSTGDDYYEATRKKLLDLEAAAEE